MTREINMNVLDELKNEHGLIRHFLENLTLGLEKMEGGARPPAEFFEKAVRFARTFADQYHHFKEEHILFLRLAERKQGALDAELTALRFEHERGRSLISDLERGIAGYAAGDAQKTAQVIESVAAYTSLLRHHIHREDHVFYPMAAEALTEEDMRALRGAFDEARAKFGDYTFEESHKVMTDMGSMIVHL